MDGYDHTIATTTVYALGRCPERGCKARRRLVVADAPVKRTQFHTWTDWQIPAAAPYGLVHARLGKGSDRHNGWGANPRPSQWLANNTREYDAAWYAAVDSAGWICTAHDRFMVVVEVRGTVNLEKPCTGACRGAIGPSCDCVCGGAGHGANWG